MKFLVRRFAATLFVLWGVCTITFFLLHLTPGDPIEMMLQQKSAGGAADSLRHDLGLDLPLHSQYFLFFNKLFHGDLGQSFTTKRPVLDELKEALPNTFILAVCSMLFAIGVGIPLGVLSAVKKHSWIDSMTSGYSLIGLSLPSFWLGPMLIIIFSIKLDWLPVNEANSAASIILPAVSLGFGLSAVLLRMTRAALLEVLNEDYVRVARAKGLREGTVYLKHALKNAMTPIVTVLSLQFGAVLTGLVITETIFDWPGLGVLLFSGLQSRNYPLVQGCVLFISLLYVLVNLLTDFAYIAINPRLRQS